jgi:hypothetical protein
VKPVVKTEKEKGIKELKILVEKKLVKKCELYKI